MNKCLRVSYRFCHTALAILAAVSAGLVFLLNFFHTASVAYNSSEVVTLSGNGKDSLLALLAVGLFLCLVWIGRDRIVKWHIPEKKVFVGLTVLYAVAALYLIINVDGNIRADAATTFHTASAFTAGDYSAFQPEGYMYTYPHQLGLMTFDRLLQLFSPHPKMAFVVNFLLVIVINYILYKIADMLFSNRWVNLLTMVLSFGFLPQLFFILFAYGLIPGLCAMVLAVYFALQFERTSAPLPLVLMLVFLSLAVILKMNFLIGGVAIALYFFLSFLKQAGWQKVLAIALVVVYMVLPSKILISCYEIATDCKLDNGSPSMLWVAMDTDMDNRWRAPGWYDGSNLSIYKDNGCDAEKSAAVAREKVAANLEKMKQNPREAFLFFKDKTVSQWCDPMYQSVWSGPLDDCGQKTSTYLLQDIFSGGKANQLITGYATMLNLFLWGMALVFLCFFAKGRRGWELPFTFFIGGLLFHTFWEGKSQYIMPYVILLIPFAAYGFYRLCGLEVWKKVNTLWECSPKDPLETMKNERTDNND